MISRRQLFSASAVFLILISGLGAYGQTDNKSEWQTVEQAIGRPGQAQADGAYKFSFPRSDLKVTVEDVELKPALALGGWVAFSKPGAGSMVMGDLVLSEDEVTPVMSSLENSGLQVTALHNHLLHESPRVMYMHVGGHGDAVKLADAIKEAFALTKVPAAKPPAAAAAGYRNRYKSIEQALDIHGKINGGVFQVGVPRSRIDHRRRHESTELHGTRHGHQLPANRRRQSSHHRRFCTHRHVRSIP